LALNLKPSKYQRAAYIFKMACQNLVHAENKTTVVKTLCLQTVKQEFGIEDCFVSLFILYMAM
jgi:hypothetical protein